MLPLLEIVWCYLEEHTRVKVRGIQCAVTERHELIVQETDPHLLGRSVEAVCGSRELWERWR